MKFKVTFNTRTRRREEHVCVGRVMAMTHAHACIFVMIHREDHNENATWPQSKHYSKPLRVVSGDVNITDKLLWQHAHVTVQQERLFCKHATHTKVNVIKRWAHISPSPPSLNRTVMFDSCMVDTKCAAFGVGEGPNVVQPHIID